MGPIVYRGVVVGLIRSQMRRNDQSSRSRSLQSTELATQSKTHERPHTVTKEHERNVSVRKESSRERGDQIRHSPARVLVEARLASGKLNTPHLRIRRNIFRPITE
jgi:hypothetical protein